MTFRARTGFIAIVGAAVVLAVAAVSIHSLGSGPVLEQLAFPAIIGQSGLTPLGQVLGTATGGVLLLLLAHLLLIRSFARRANAYAYQASHTAADVPPAAGDELDPLFESIRKLIEANRVLRDKQVSEEQLLAAKRYADGVIASMSDILIVTDPNLNILTVNNAACETLEYSQLELIGSPVERLFKQEAYGMATPLKQLLQQRVRDTELTYRTQSGKLISALVSASQMRDNAGRVLAIITVGKDISARKQIERDLLEAKSIAEAANRAKSAFVANMSHEIRTPMTAILGFTDLLAQPALQTDERLRCIETIRRNGQHLLAIINDILDVSKIEAGKMTVERIGCSPVEIVRDVASLMSGRASDKGLSFDVRYTGPVPATIQSDPTRLRQILMNLMSNAIKFTSQGSVKLIVGLSESKPQKLRVDVVDTGPGLSEQQLQTLFKPFAQADSSTTRRFGGTGLGLMISKRLATMLGGDIVVHSVPDSGSTFSVTLDVGDISGVKMIQSPRTMWTPQQEAGTQAPARLCGRVLLAEDGPDNQRLIQHYLEEMGVEVALAANGREAVEQALAAAKQGRPFHLILMDMQMPELDGYGATQELRQAGYRRPIVALTAHAMESDRQRCIAMGCEDFAVKPIEYDQFMRMIRRFVPEASAETSDAQSSTREKLMNKPGMAKLVISFVEGLDERMQALTEAIDHQDRAAIKRLAHQLRGAAGGYGFPRISESAQRIEHAADGDLASVAEAMTHLQSLVREAIGTTRSEPAPA
jgi:PAS domain S-box-containing protein